jgi:hypothetical protein
MRPDLDSLRDLGPLTLLWPPTVYELSDKRYEVVFEQRNGPACTARGDTPERALAAIKRTIVGYW